MFCVSYEENALSLDCKMQNILVFCGIQNIFPKASQQTLIAGNLERPLSPGYTGKEGSHMPFPFVNGGICTHLVPQIRSFTPIHISSLWDAF